MEDKKVMLFHCACDCKVAIKNILYEYHLNFEDRVEVLKDIRYYINCIVGDDEDD